VEQDQENNQTKNSTEADIDAILNSKDKKAYKCGIKIVQVSRTGQMQLKIASSPN